MKLQPTAWARLASLAIACTSILPFTAGPTAQAQSFEAFEAIADSYYPFAGSAYNGHFFYTPGLDPTVPANFYGTDGFRWVANGLGSFVENANGTASLTGLLKSQFYPTRGFAYNVTFTGRSNVPLQAGDGIRELLATAYSEAGGPVVVSSWHYYADYVGVLNGTGDYAGGSIRITPFMHSFQVGTGASGKNVRPGASGWFMWEVLSQPSNPAFVFRASNFYSPPLYGDMNYNIRLPGPPTGRLGDFVWKDSNSNGIQDAGEPGINNVLVTLKDNNDVFLGTTLTGPHPSIPGQNGYYQFTGLTAGTYKVYVDNNSPALAGCVPTTVNAPGSTTANDSNPIPAIGVLPTDSSEDQTLDFGYVAVVVNPGFQVMKMVDKTTINAGEPVTYTYTVKNTGATTLTDIELIDDNSTPNFPGDDFIVVTGLTLAPGTQQSFTLTKFVPITVCIPVNNIPTPSGTLIVQQLPNLDWRVIYRQSLAIVDNTYGANASPDWKNGHTFGNFTGSDKAEFRFTNGAGTKVLDVYIDYITASAAYPSGYGSLGATGGDGSVVTGSAANIASFTTTMTTNLNQSPAFYGFTVDSPAPPANFPTWDYVDGYTLVVKNSTFGASGFGGVTVGEVHNSPPKIGQGGNIPTTCDSDAKNTAKGTAKSGNTVLMAQADATVHIIGQSSGASQPFTTYKRDSNGWDGATAGALLTSKFPTLYPTGLIVGGSKTLKFTSPAAVQTFLPSSGTAKALTASAVDPTTSSAGTLAGNTIALQLNVDFSNAGFLKPGLANLKLKSGKFAGQTVAQVLAIANAVLGGAAPPAGTSISDVDTAAKTINENYDKGTTDKGNLIP